MTHYYEKEKKNQKKYNPLETRMWNESMEAVAMQRHYFSRF